MTEVTYYIAEDGKKFEDEDECREYEREHVRYNLKPGDFEMWDSNGAVTDNMGNCFYMHCKTEEACRYAFELSEDTGDSCPFCSDFSVSPGFYYYDMGTDCWKDFNAELNAIKSIAKIFGIDIFKSEEDRKIERCKDCAYLKEIDGTAVCFYRGIDIQRIEDCNRLAE